MNQFVPAAVTQLYQLTKALLMTQSAQVTCLPQMNIPISSIDPIILNDLTGPHDLNALKAIIRST